VIGAHEPNEALGAEGVMGPAARRVRPPQAGRSRTPRAVFDGPAHPGPTAPTTRPPRPDRPDGPAHPDGPPRRPAPTARQPRATAPTGPAHPGAARSRSPALPRTRSASVVVVALMPLQRRGCHNHDAGPAGGGCSARQVGHDHGGPAAGRSVGRTPAVARLVGAALPSGRPTWGLAYPSCYGRSVLRHPEHRENGGIRDDSGPPNHRVTSTSLAGVVGERGLIAPTKEPSMLTCVRRRDVGGQGPRARRRAAR
jgi:hypothetical protein